MASVATEGDQVENQTCEATQEVRDEDWANLEIGNKDRGDSVTLGSGDPVMLGSGDPVTLGSGDPVAQRSRDLAVLGSGRSVELGTETLHRRGVLSSPGPDRLGGKVTQREVLSSAMKTRNLATRTLRGPPRAR
eukprot:superscaffoldBa00003034_g15938